MRFFGHRITGTTKAGGKKDYRVELNFPEEADEDGIARFEITGASKRAGTETWQEVTLRGEMDLAQELIRVSYEGRELGRVPMADLPSDGPLGRAGDEIDNDDAIERGLEFLEQISEHIPVDPFLGCLLRSAAIASIGQIVRCWLANRGTAEDLHSLARSIGSCLREYGTRMLLKFTFKAGKCAVTCGLL